MGSLQTSGFSTEGLFGYSFKSTFIFPEVPGLTLFPQSVKINYLCSGPISIIKMIIIMIVMIIVMIPTLMIIVIVIMITVDPIFPQPKDYSKSGGAGGVLQLLQQIITEAKRIRIGICKLYVHVYDMCIMLFSITLYYVILYYVTLCYSILYYIIIYHIISYYIIL